MALAMAILGLGCTVVTPTPSPPGGSTRIPTPTPTPTHILLAWPTPTPTPTPTQQYRRHIVVAQPTPTPTPTPLPSIHSLLPMPLPSNVILYEDFEIPFAGDRWISFDGGLVGGWTVEGSVDFVGSFWKAARGRQSLDIHGWSAGAIAREFATTPGQIYEVCFALSGNPSGGDSIKVMEVWWNALLVDRIAVDTTGRSPSQMGWVYQGYRLTAQEVTSRLKFQGVGGGSHWGAVIDDITVVIGESGCKGEMKFVVLPAPTPISAPTSTPTPTPSPTPTVIPFATPTPSATPTATPTPTPTVPPATPTPTSTPVPTPTPLFVVPGARVINVADNVDLLPGSPLSVQVVLNNPSERELERMLVWRFVTKRGDARVVMRVLPAFVEIQEGHTFSIPKGETIVLGIISVPSGVAPFQIQKVFVDVKTGSGTLIESLLVAQNIRVPETLEPSSLMNLQFLRVDEKELEVVFSGSLENRASEDQSVRIQSVSCSFKKGRTTIFVDGDEKSLSEKVLIAQRGTASFEVRVEPEESIAQVPRCELSFQRVLQR